uniref:CSON002963 protein n=1 Tax=Culicoides sonorensis TaxID=179676 RepID=A0A336L415_CULSO
MKIFPRSCSFLSCAALFDLNDKKYPYSITAKHTDDPFRSFVYIKNNSKKDAIKVAIQICEPEQDFRVRPYNVKESHGKVLDSENNVWYEVEINPNKIFTFAIKYILGTDVKEEFFLTQERCLVTHIDEVLLEDFDMEAVLSGDHTGLKVSKFCPV